MIEGFLTEITREGVRRMIAEALRNEVDALVAGFVGETLPGGAQARRAARLRPKRSTQTGIGPIEVSRAKVRDRAEVPREEEIRFASEILPRWARRSKSLYALLPIFYLRGISIGAFQGALAALLGKDAPTLSPWVIA